MSLALAALAVGFIAACGACVLIGRAFRLPFDVPVPGYPDVGESAGEDQPDRTEV